MFASQIGKDIMNLMLDVNKLRDEVTVKIDDSNEILKFIFDYYNDIVNHIM